MILRASAAVTIQGLGMYQRARNGSQAYTKSIQRQGVSASRCTKLQPTVPKATQVRWSAIRYAQSTTRCAKVCNCASQCTEVDRDVPSLAKRAINRTVYLTVTCNQVL